MKIKSTLEDSYAGAFDNAVGFGKRPVLLLIDFVQAYFEASHPLFAEVEDAFVSALRIRQLAHEKSMPVICTNVVFTKVE